MALVTKGFKDILSFSRNSEKTYFDKDGVLQKAGANEPAFDHDPVTGESLGLSVHEQRTNLLLHSEAFDNAYWAKLGGTSVIANAVQSPDGAVTADKVIEGVASGPHGVRAGFVATGVYTISVYVKKAELQYVWISDTAYSEYKISFDLDGRSVIQTGSAAAVNILDSGVADKGDGWLLCHVTLEFTTANTSTTVGITGNSSGTSGYPFGPYYGSDGTKGVYIWGAQLEQG